MLYASGESAGSEHSTTGGWFALLVNAPSHVPPMLPMARYAPLPDVLTGLSRRTVVRNHAHSHHHSLQSVKACRPWAAPREDGLRYCLQSGRTSSWLSVNALMACRVLAVVSRWPNPLGHVYTTKISDMDVIGLDWSRQKISRTGFNFSKDLDGLDLGA